MELSPRRIVGIGYSAGGLEPCLELMSEISAESRDAIVILPHLSRHFVSQLVEILQRYTPLAVNPIRNGQRAGAGNVYVLPPQLLGVHTRRNAAPDPASFDPSQLLHYRVFFEPRARTWPPRGRRHSLGKCRRRRGRDRHRLNQAGRRHDVRARPIDRPVPTYAPSSGRHRAGRSPVDRTRNWPGALALI